MTLEYANWDQWSTHIQIGAQSTAGLARAVEIARSVMADVTLAASRFEPGTQILRLNAAAGSWVNVSPTMLALLREACRVAELTQGLVTPLTGASLAGIGYDRDIAEVGGTAVRVVPITHDWTEIEFASDAVRIPAGSMLDLGASAKAWTADEIVRRAVAHGAEPVVASIGGDIAVGGECVDGFLVEVSEREHPAPHDATSSLIRIFDGGLATSSTVVRRWHSATDEMHHILDPRTALPAQGPFRTVSVAAASCADANAASTAAIIMGESAVPWLNRAKLPARLIDQTGDVLTVAGWPDEPA